MHQKKQLYFKRYYKEMAMRAGLFRSMRRGPWYNTNINLLTGMLLFPNLWLSPLMTSAGQPESMKAIALPNPQFDSGISLEQTLAERRAVREYADQPLELADLSQLLWAAQGITNLQGYRTAPSAGALYPLELYVVSGKVSGLPAGIYHYRPQRHELVHTLEGDHRNSLAKVALGQRPVADAPAVIVFTAIYQRTARKYGNRAVRYVHMEVGHATQNLILQATALKLATVVIGAFNDSSVSRVIRLPEAHEPFYLIPVGLPEDD